MIVCAVCDEQASERANGRPRTPYQHKWGPTTHDFEPLTVSRYTIENGRRFKRGFAPSELMHPIAATCALCGGALTIYPAGAACANCSPAGLAEQYRADLDRQRVRIGAMPESEL